MSKVAVVWSCGHAKPEVSNERFSWLGSLIEDIKPDYCIDLGDGADMCSLNSYDTRYPQAIVSQNYQADIESYNESQDRIWSRFKEKKKKRPWRIGLEGNHCVPENTDILTRNKGWVPIKEVEVGDTILSMSGWEPVLETVEVDYDGDLYKIGDRSVVSYVTADHRVYYYTCSGALLVKPASEVPVSLDLPVATKTGGGVDLSDAQLRFNAVAMTDSHHGYKNNLVFYQSGDKADIIEGIIKSASIDYKKRTRNRNITEICGKVLKSCQTSYEFSLQRPDWCHDNNKGLPDWVYNLSQEQFEVFLETLIFCDGTIPDKVSTARVFYGKKKICEDVQALCVTKGYRATLSEYRPDQWRVNIVKTTKCRAHKQNLGNFKGKVYCLVVPSQNFLMRQDYKPCFTGNCNRIKKALANDPRIEGEKFGVSFKHLQTDHWFDEYFEYENGAPAIVDVDGISYAHYFAAGNYGKAISGTHHAYALLQRRGASSTCGHSHRRDIYFKDFAHPRPVIGCIVGCYKGSDEKWGGQSNREWWKGVVIKREIDNGVYEPQFVSLETLRREYGN